MFAQHDFAPHDTQPQQAQFMQMRHLIGPLVLCVELSVTGTLAADDATSPAAQSAPPTDNAAREQRQAKRDRLASEALRLISSGQADEALAAAEQALTIQRELDDDQFAPWTTIIEWVARRHEDADRFEDAIHWRTEALRVQTRLLGEDHWQVVDARLDLEHAQRLQELTAEQRQQLSQADSAARSSFKLFSTGQYAEAAAIFRTVLETRRRVLGDRGRDHATNLNTLAGLYYMQADYLQAESLHRQALAIRKEVLGERHPDFAASLNNLAELYRTQADYARAEPLYRQALEVTKEALGERSAEYATSLDNLACLYYFQGDYAQSEPLSWQALEIRKEVLGERSAEYATSLNNLAELYRSQTDYARAEPLYQQALELTRDTQGERHPDYALTLGNLAEMYRYQRNYARAEPLFRQALEIQKEALGEQHPDYAWSLHRLALLYHAQGDYARAQRLLRQALRIRKEVLGEGHPDYALSLNHLAISLSDLDRASEGLPLSLDAVRITKAALEAAAAVQSERQQMAMAGNLAWHASLLLSLGQIVGASGDDLYPALLSQKGQVLTRQLSIRQLRELTVREPDSPAAQNFLALADRTRKLDRLAKMVPIEKELDTHRQQLEDLTLEIERLQQTLAGASAEYRKSQEQAQLTPQQLAAQLPRDAALVDLRAYRQYLPHNDEHKSESGDQQYVAFIMRPEQPVSVIWLGAAEPINTAVGAWRDNLGTGPSAEAGQILRQLVWEHLEPHLTDAETILISPDGDLNLLPWGALPGREPGTFLIEERGIVAVPAPPLLPELLDHAPEPDAAPSLLAVGDVDYGADPGVMELAANDRSASAARSDDGLWHWDPLRNTRVEVVSIEDTFRRTFRGGVSFSLREEEATEQAFRSEAPQATYLHLATHGYFAPERLRSLLSVTRTDEPGESLFQQQDVSGWHPGLLSGIVLAGANQPPAIDHDDGVLTALEVSELDLSHVDLVTLSACETGLGETAGGEGVLGLQRAFQLAGARTCIASLWQVPDDATRSLMIEFYENLWRRKMSRIEALRQAQLTMLREGANRGITLDDEQPARQQRLPPYYWAAFQLSGDWR